MSEAPASVRGKNFFATTFNVFKETFRQWLEDKAPQLGAALAYYTVFSLAPLILTKERAGKAICGLWTR